MPSYEAAASGMMYQFFPGELFCSGAEAFGVTGLKTPINNPASFYSEPEWQQNREDATFKTHAVELRATLSLYNNNSDYGGSLYPELDTASNRAVYQSPRTWKDPLVYYFDISGSPPPPAELNFLTLLGVGA